MPIWEPLVVQIPHVMVSIPSWLHNYITCATVGITCRALDSLENGTIGYSSLVTTEPFSYETTATYRCDPGYNITRGNNVRTCTGDGSTPSGQWNGAAPQCPRMFYYI